LEETTRVAMQQPSKVGIEGKKQKRNDLLKKTNYTRPQGENTWRLSPPGAVEGIRSKRKRGSPRDGEILLGRKEEKNPWHTQRGPDTPGIDPWVF